MARRAFGWLVALALLIGGTVPMTAGAGEAASPGTALVKGGKHGKGHGKKHGKRHGKKHGMKHGKKATAAVQNAIG